MTKSSMLMACLVFARPAFAQTPQPKMPPGAKFELMAGKASFAAGEPIAVTLRFSTESASFYLMRFGADWENTCFPLAFTAADGQGKAVPACAGPTSCIIAGPLPTVVVTKEKPYQQTVFVNEWLAIDAPGKYEVRAYREVNSRGFFSENPLEPNGSALLASAPLTLEITAPDEAARKDLFERAAKILSDDKSEQPERNDVMRELRLVRDERALPFLARGLFGDAAGHADYGLQNFPDAAKVKAALLRVPDEPGAALPPEAFSRLVRALTDADLRARHPELKRFDKEWQRQWTLLEKHWQAALLPRRKEQIAHLTRGEAAEATVEMLAYEPTVRDDAALWQRVLRDAPLMSQEKQHYLGNLLEPRDGKGTSELPRDAGLRPLLSQVAFNERLDNHLRSSALRILLLTGDTEVSEKIFQDLKLSSPKFGRDAHVLLGDYKAGERAVLLLARLRAAKSWMEREKATFYVRDCGQGATLEELCAAFDYLVKMPRANALPIVQAVALKSPRDGFALLAKLLANRGRFTQFDRDRAYDEVLKRLALPEARALMIGILRGGAADDRKGLVQALGGANPPRWPERGLPLLRFGNERYAGELIALAQSGPTQPVRAEACRVLHYMTWVPKTNLAEAYQKNPAALFASWRKWWAENQARFEK